MLKNYFRDLLDGLPVIVILWIFAFIMSGSQARGAAPTFTGLYYFENNYSDSSGNGNTGSQVGSLKFITTTPMPMAGTYSLYDAQGGSVSIPTTVFTAGMVSSKVASAGISFFCTEALFQPSADSGLMSWLGTGGDAVLYTAWSGGSRYLIVHIGSSTGTQSAGTVKVDSWLPGRWYDIWMTTSPSGVAVYLYDWAAQTTTNILNIATTVSLAGISQVNVGDWNGIVQSSMVLDNAWFSSSSVTTDPFVGSTNWDVGVSTGKRAFAVVHCGDSSILGYGCTPTASNYYPTGGDRVEMEADAYGNTYTPVFYSIGTQYYGTGDPAAIFQASPMMEGFSGQTSPLALTDMIADAPYIFQGTASGRSLIFIDGGFHGDTVFGFGGPYTEAQVESYMNALISYQNINWPAAKIVIEDNYLIQGGVTGGCPCGGTQNLGMLDSYNDQLALGRPVYHLDSANPASTYYFDIANATGTCADQTHPMKGSPGYISMADAEYAFLSHIVAIPSASACH